MSEQLERLVNLRQYQQDGKRHPHKPLLVLLDLGQLAKYASSAVPRELAELKLELLIAEFGLTAMTAPAHSEAHPFARLQSHGVWEVTPHFAPSKSSPMELRNRGGIGGLVPDLEIELAKDVALLRWTARGNARMTGGWWAEGFEGAGGRQSQKI